MRHSNEAEKAIRLLIAEVAAKQLKGELTKEQEQALTRALGKAIHAIRVRSYEQLLAAVGNFAKKYLRYIR